MATKWEETARSADTDNIDAKIGVSTDAESKPTLFGRILGIKNVVDWIKNTWTATKAGLLDVAVSSRAPASTALSTATWTAARAGKLDNLDGKISEVGKSLNTYSIPSDNVKLTLPGVTLKIPGESIEVMHIATSFRYFPKFNGGVRIKVYFTKIDVATSIFYFHPYGRNVSSSFLNNSLFLMNLNKPIGTTFKVARALMDFLGSFFTIQANTASVSYDINVLNNTPFVAFSPGRPNDETTITISKIEICYDEVDI